eukprot:11556964-Karenia_brevis.AAC.1
MDDLDVFATDATDDDTMYMYMGCDPCGSVPVGQGRNHTRVSHVSTSLSSRHIDKQHDIPAMILVAVSLAARGGITPG